jgi:hypothetical protein
LKIINKGQSVRDVVNLRPTVGFGVATTLPKPPKNGASA